MSVNQLETVVCNPIKFQRILMGNITDISVKNPLQSEYPPNSDDTDIPWADVDSGSDSDISRPRCTQLLPGGRFLVSIAPVALKVIVRCWDLDQQYGNELREPLAQWCPEDDFDAGICVMIKWLKIQPVWNDPDTFNIMLMGDNLVEYVFFKDITKSTSI
ncbi:hypothetical protein DL93DRAFT_2076914 [Clavulina sp. PMI_390]|nr:hypothetical protein DL93DRAFT_2076914 [Clavulina sp. PMI_390]